jgi:HSP20 family protein
MSTDDSPETDPTSRAVELPDRAERRFAPFSWSRVWPDLWRPFGDDDLVRVEEYTEGESVVIRAELPGIDPEKDVEITIHDNELRITGERRQERRTEDDKGFRSEFRYGSFTRVVRLPVGASEHDVRATYTDGVLEVRVPVDRGTAEARRVPVHRA